MIKRLPIVITVVALAGGGIVSTALAGSDQYAQSHQSTPATHDTQQENGAWAQNRTAFLDARLAALHAGLQLTPDQEKLWPPVETALRDFSKTIASIWRARRDREEGLDPVARLEKRSDTLIARGQALKKIADAAKPLYATLTDAQKERLPILLRAIHHPFASEMRHHKGWRHDEDQRNDEDQDQDKMEQHMRGNHMMMNHEDHEDHDSQDNDND